MLLVVEFPAENAPAGFIRRFCEALNDLNLPERDTVVAVMTSHETGQPRRRIECESPTMVKHLRAIVTRLEPTLMEAQG